MIIKENVEKFIKLTDRLEKKLKELEKLDNILKKVTSDSIDAETIKMIENEYIYITQEIKQIKQETEVLRKKL